jgi:hypothetical protein
MRELCGIFLATFLRQTVKATLASVFDNSFAILKLIMRDAGKLTTDIYDAAALPQLPPAWPAISL